MFYELRSQVIGQAPVAALATRSSLINLRTLTLADKSDKLASHL
jgi:hypothetical protein